MRQKGDHSLLFPFFLPALSIPDEHYRDRLKFRMFSQMILSFEYFVVLIVNGVAQTVLFRFLLFNIYGLSDKLKQGRLQILSHQKSGS